MTDHPDDTAFAELMADIGRTGRMPDDYRERLAGIVVTIGNRLVPGPELTADDLMQWQTETELRLAQHLGEGRQN